MLSKSCVYGLRAAIYVALVKKDNFVSIREISSKLDISFYFLTKILQILTQKNIMISFKGPKGGIKLARPAEQISLMEVVLALDGQKLFEQCILGLPGCGILNPCPLHEEWSQAVEILKTTFNNTTLAQLAQRIKDDNLRLTKLNERLFWEDSKK